MPVPPPSAGALTFINARMGVGATTLRILGTHIVALGAAAELGDRVIDLQGDRLLPGLINAHDHLQLNSLPRLKLTCAAIETCVNGSTTSTRADDPTRHSRRASLFHAMSAWRWEGLRTC